jgi:hypothetical protein
MNVIVIITLLLSIFAVIFFFIILANNNDEENDNINCSHDIESYRELNNLCCIYGDKTTTFIYDKTTDLTMAPFPTDYISVCKGFCPRPLTGEKCESKDSEANNKTKSCIDNLKPGKCPGSALPVARLKTVLYYGYKAGSKGCDQCCTCGQTCRDVSFPCSNDIIDN